MAERIVVGGPRFVDPETAWFEVEGEERARKLFETVQAIEQRQSSITEGHNRHAELYAAYCPPGMSWGTGESVRPPAQATRNVVRSVCDTATALISKTWPRPRVVTDAGDWEVQNRAELLDRALVGIYRRAHVYQNMQLAFRDSTIFGTGAVVLRECGKGKDYYVEADRILMSDLIVDEQECDEFAKTDHWYLRRAMPKRIAVRKYAKGNDELKAKILSAAGKASLMWAGRTHVPKDHVIIIEAWHIGHDGEAGVHGIYGVDFVLSEEEWKHPWAPIIVLYWSPPISGFYGDGVAYRQFGRQKRINYLYRWVQRCQDLIAVPRVWVDAVNGPLKVQISNEIGEVVGYNGKPPEFQTPQAVGPETYNWLDRLEAGGFEDEGIAQATSTGQLPKGLESAPAQREYSFKEGTRFAPVSQRWEDAVARETAEKALALYKAHYMSYGEEYGSPQVTWSSKSLYMQIDWENVDLETEQYEIRVEASSLEDLSPAGRLQAVIELSQTGWIEPAMGRKLLGHPDIEREDEISTAAEEHAEWIAMNLKRGNYIPPNIYGDLEAQDRIVRAELLRAEMNGAGKDAKGKTAMRLMTQFLREVDSKLHPADMMPQNMGGMPGMSPPIDPATGMPAGVQAAPAPAMSLPASQGLGALVGSGQSRQNF